MLYFAPRNKNHAKPFNIMGFDTITVNVNLATELGLEQAIVLTTLKGWHNFNRHNPSYVRGEYVWCLTSRKHLQETFPFLSDRIIRGTIEKLSEQGFITKCEKEGSKDFWLSLTQNGLALFEGGVVKVEKPVETKPKLTIEEKRAIFKEKCEPFVEKYGRQMVDAFVEYWTEANENRLRCEVKKAETGAFEISRRLANWASKEYNQPSQPAQPTRPKKEIWEELGITREQYLEMHKK